MSNPNPLAISQHRRGEECDLDFGVGNRRRWRWQAEFGSEQKCLAAIAALKELWRNDFGSYWGVELTRIRSCRIGIGLLSALWCLLHAR